VEQTARKTDSGEEKAARMDRQTIEERAYRLRELHGMDGDIDLDVVELAGKMRFAVTDLDLDDNDDGFILVGPEGKDILGCGASRIIGVNRHRDYYQKRFIIAHELGHYVLYGENQPLFAHRESKAEPRGMMEQDIDYFAACLLMPGERFQKLYDNFRAYDGGRLDDRMRCLQWIFRAPLESVMRRIGELGLAT